MGSHGRLSVPAGLVSAFALLLLALPGCSYPPAIHTHEYLTSYERMSDGFDPLLSLVYVPRADAFSRYNGVIIGDIGIGETWVEAPAEARGFTTFLRICLRSKLIKLKKFDFVTLDKKGDWLEPQDLDETLLLEGKITKFDMGSGFLRYFSYFLVVAQLGATDLQFEGRISEASTGRLLMEFADRRRQLCNTPFGPNPHNFQRGYAMRVTAMDVAQCLVHFIDISYESLPAVNAFTQLADRGETITKDLP
ncbi:MAG: hypothetical protein ACYS8K_04515 [Planctomycetota bacterium]|jgi:hypothetical protein